MIYLEFFSLRPNLRKLQLIRPQRRRQRRRRQQRRLVLDEGVEQSFLFRPQRRRRLVLDEGVEQRQRRRLVLDEGVEQRQRRRKRRSLEQNLRRRGQNS